MPTYNAPLPPHREPGGEGIVADDVNMIVSAVEELRTKSPTGPKGEDGVGLPGPQGDPGPTGPALVLGVAASIEAIPAGSPVGSWWAVVS